MSEASLGGESQNKTTHVDTFADSLSDAGSIPAASTIFTPSTSGQNGEESGQFLSQPGQTEEVAKEGPVEEGTGNTLRGSKAGHPSSTIGAQQEHNASGIHSPADPDAEYVLASGLNP